MTPSVTTFSGEAHVLCEADKTKFCTVIVLSTLLTCPTPSKPTTSSTRLLRTNALTPKLCKPRPMSSLSTQSHASLVEFGQRHVTKGLGRQVEAVIEKGEGSYVTLGDGRTLLDFTCGIGVTNLGACICSSCGGLVEELTRWVCRTLSPEGFCGCG